MLYVLARTAQVMNELKTDDPAKVRAAYAIDLPTIQRYLRLHYSVTIDLFGADQSSNAATFYSSGLKGRYEEGKRDDDHVLKGQSYKVLEVQNGQLVEKEVPMLNVLNEVLRDDFSKDSVAGVTRWNKVLERLASPRGWWCHGGAQPPDRRPGRHSLVARRPGGERGRVGCAQGRVAAHRRGFRLRRIADGPRGRARKFAGWIAPPPMGINRQPIDFEYVRFN